MTWYLPFSHLIPITLIIYCDKADYGIVPGGRVETGAKGVQAVVVTGQGGCGRDADGGVGGGTDGWGVSINPPILKPSSKYESTVFTFDSKYIGNLLQQG